MITLYDMAKIRLEGIHQQYGILSKLVLCRFDLYEDKLRDLETLEQHCKEKLRLDELSDMLERIRVAKKNCKIKMNKYKQEDLC